MFNYLVVCIQIIKEGSHRHALLCLASLSTTQDMLIKRTKCLSFHFICCNTSNLHGVSLWLILLSNISLDITPKMCEPLSKIHFAIFCRNMCRCSSISEWMHALYSTLVLCNQLTYFPDKASQAASFPNDKTCPNSIKWKRCWWHVVSIWVTHSHKEDSSGSGCTLSRQYVTRCIYDNRFLPNFNQEHLNPHSKMWFHKQIR